MEFSGVMDIELQYLKIEYTNAELTVDNLREILDYSIGSNRAKKMVNFNSNTSKITVIQSNFCFSGDPERIGSHSDRNSAR